MSDETHPALRTDDEHDRDEPFFHAPDINVEREPTEIRRYLDLADASLSERLALAWACLARDEVLIEKRGPSWQQTERDGVGS